MRKALSIIVLLLASYISVLAQSGTTAVTATVRDSQGNLYVNCQWSAVFVGENTTPGAGPYAPAPLLNGQQGNCTSLGTISVNLADNINTVTPSPSQWNFSICSAQGYVAGPYCRANILITITGATQDISSILTPLMPVLPPSGNGVPVTFNGPPTGSCNPTQTAVNVLTGDYYSCSAGAWVKIGPGTGGGGGGGNINPGTALSQAPTWTGSIWTPQVKPVYNVADFGFVGGGSTYNTSAAVTLVSAINGAQAKITGPPGVVFGIGDFVWPSNVELDFTSGWQLKTITDGVTTPGNGTYDATGGATGQCQTGAGCNSPSNVFSIAVTAVANDTYAVQCGRGFSGGVITLTSNVASDIILPVGATSPSFSSIQQAWYIPNVVSGAHTFIATSSSAIAGACTALPISGLGPTPVLDGVGGICSNVSLNSPYACSASFTAGSFLVFGASQNNTTETCGAVGGGFTLAPSTAGCSTATTSNLAVAYQASAAGGTASPTVAFSPSPAGHGWSAITFGLRPGTALNIIQGQIDCVQNCFVNAAGSSGGINLVGNTVPMRVKPTWWGASYATGANQTTNTSAVNAAIKAALGSGNSQYNKVLDLSGGIYQINGETQWYSIAGSTAARFQVDCANGGLAQNTPNLRIMDGNAIAYGRFDNCAWIGNASSTAALVSLDWNSTNVPSVANSLKPQFLDFYGNSFVGNTLVDSGLLIAPSGGGAQGSNINCFDCAFQSFTGSGLQVGGDGTGRNVGRNAATNAIQIGVYGGDFQGIPLYGISCYACQDLIVDGTTFEDGFSAVLGPDNQTGFDMYSQNCIGGLPPLPSLVVRSVRSESRRLIAGCNIDVRDSGTINQAAFPTPGSGQPVGTIIMGSVLSDGKYYRVTVDTSAASGAGSPSSLLHASSGSTTTLTDTNYTTTGTLTSFPTLCTLGETMTQASTAATAVINIVTGQAGPLLTAAPTGSPDNSHTWTGGSSGCVFTPTAVPVVEVNWTTNAFANFQLSTIGGTNSGCKGVISSNTSNSVTVASWTTTFAQTVCSAPASGSTFLIEPNWGTQFSSGGLTWVDQAENGIEGQSGAGLGNSVFENVDVPGDRIAISIPNNVILKNVSTTRNDWANLPSGNSYQTGAIISNRFDVYNRFTSASNGVTTYQNWSLPRTSGGRTYLSTPFQDDLGTRVLAWECGDPSSSGNQGACNDVWIGGRSDFKAGSNVFRNRLEYSGMLGAAVPLGTDQNGLPTRIGGGGSTGAGTPGAIEFWIGSTGSSGTSPNTGSRIAFIDANGYNGPLGGTTSSAATVTALTITGCSAGSLAKADGTGCATNGGGTVTNTGGSLTSNAIVLGAGTNDTKVSTGLTSNGTAEMDLGVTGTNGVLGFIGLTSGKATLTGPSVAGTTTNPIVSTNTIQAPDFEGTIGAATPAAGTFTAVTDNTLTVGNCVQVTTGGLLTTSSGPCGTSTGTITATGSPVSGNLTKFSGATSITNGDLSGDVTTSGTLAAEVVGLVNKTLPALNPGCLDYSGTVWQFVSCITSLASPGPIGGTTPGTGAFTTLTSNGANVSVVFTSGSKALNTNNILSGQCDDTTVTVSGLATTDVIQATFNGDVTGVTGYIPTTSGTLTIYIYPTTNTIHFKVCNPTSSGITPGFVTLNYRVTR